MMKKKSQSQESKKQTSKPINQHVLNYITPDGIDISATNANIGENYGKIYVQSQYPSKPEYGWLSDLCNLEGTASCMQVRFTDPTLLQKAYDKKYDELGSEAQASREQSKKQQLEKQQADVKKMIRRVSVDKEPLIYLNTTHFVQERSERGLNDRVKTVAARVAASSGGLRHLRMRQKQALESLSPFGIPDPEVYHVGERNMPLSTFLGGFPMASAGINDPGGIYLGRAKNGRLLFLNHWLRGNDRTNSNFFIAGVPGSGKSTVLKDIILRDYALGTKYIIFDVEAEFADLARDPDVQGDVIDCAGGNSKEGRINPLQIRKTPVVTRADFESEEEWEKDKNEHLIFENEHGGSDMALYIQQLRVFFKLYFSGEFNTAQKAALEKALIAVYNKFGITWKTDVSPLTNDQFPVMRDLYDYIEEQSKEESLTERQRNIHEELAEKLYSAAYGADSFLWNGYTTLSPKSDFVVLITAQLLDVDENVQRAQYYNMITWGWGGMSKDTNERVICAVDEGYNYVDPEYPEIMKFFRNISKRARKYEAGLMFIAHAVVDVLDPAVKRFGQAIIDNSCYKILMGCDGQNLAETSKLFNLTSREEALLSAKTRGAALLIAGNVRLQVKIDVRPKFLEMFGKRGGR